MKKYINPIPNGGAPLHNNRINNELSTEIWDVMQGLLEKYAATTEGVIISGCEVTGAGPHNISAGIVFLGGEFRRVAAVAGVTLPQYIKAATDVTTNKVFADAVSRALLIEKLADYQSSVPGSQYIAIGSAAASEERRFKNLITIANDLTTNLVYRPLSASQGVALKALIDGEISTRGSADTTLQNNIDTEATTRSTNDNLRVLKAGDTMTGTLVGTEIRASTGFRDDASQPIIRTKVIDIGVWNMDTNASVTIAHGLSSQFVIRNYKVMILFDIGAPENYRELEVADSGGVVEGWVSFTSTNVVLNRRAAGVFDSASYSTGGLNRGYIFIDYTY